MCNVVQGTFLCLDESLSLLAIELQYLGAEKYVILMMEVCDNSLAV